MPPAPDLICLLDDELSVLTALGRLLAAEGLRTEKFCEPSHFLNYARNHPIRLAVIDLRMPEMSGLEVMAELRAFLPQASVIIMTGENYPEHRIAALAGGASAFFLKPFDDEEFLRAVREAISAA
ncbi:MAG: response regulator [Verrucomicrobiota bacterium]